MSSSVTIDWRAIRERERQACLTLRAELAQLQVREKQLRIRSEAVIAAHGRLAAEIPRVRRARRSADSAELDRLVSQARTGLARSAVALDQAISSASRERARRAAATPAWTARSGSAIAPAPQAASDRDPGEQKRESNRRSAPVAPATLVADAALAAEADAVIEECRLRCPETDLAELIGLRAELGASPLHDRTVIQDIRIRAARTIQRVKREDELEEQRQRLFVLAEDASPAERAALRRRVADARPEDVPRLDQEVTAAVQRASAERSRAEAVSALEQSLHELGYDVQGGFASLTPSSAQRPAGARPAPQFVLAASPHSADHGLRVRVGENQLYLSVVRRAGTAASRDSRQADTDVQEQTCRDLVTAAATAAGKGVQLILGNAQAPGRPAPELAAEHWPAAATSASAEAAPARAAGQPPAEQSAAEQADWERRRTWAAQERQRATEQQQTRSRRPGQ